MRNNKAFSAISLVLVFAFMSIGFLLYSCDSDNDFAENRGICAKW